MNSDDDSQIRQATAKKPYFLICLAKPDEEPNQRPSPNKTAWSRWFGFSEGTKKLDPHTLEIEALNENTFLIPADRVASSVPEILNLAIQSSVDYKVFFLESHPKLCS